MWILSARKARHSSSRKQRATFRPRLEVMEDRCLLSAGALDTTFGTGGKATLANNAATDVVVQADGKIVTGATVGNQFELVRFNADGKSLDSTFGKNGVVSTTVGKGSTSYFVGLALQSDGNIVAIGSVLVAQTKVRGTTTYDWGFGLARYKPSGSLDSTFGSGGIVLTNPFTGSASPDNDAPSAIAIDANGKIVVAGYSLQSNNAYVYDLVRYNSNGALDSTFGAGGITATPNSFPNGGISNSLAIQSDGKIIVPLGGTFSGMTLARFSTNGQLDPSFGSGGIVSGVGPADYGRANAWQALPQSDGTIVVAGSYYPTANVSPHYQVLTRLASNGLVDTTFGTSGYTITTSFITADTIRLAANGDILVGAPAGVYTNLASWDFGVAAYLPNGTLDATFGNNGTSTVDFFGGQDNALGMGIQSDGKIVLAGTVANPNSPSTQYLALARFQAPNTKITSFTANPNPVAAGSSVTLSASAILNSNPTATTAQVAFYLDDGSGNLETGTDTLLGYGTNVNGVWSFSFTPTTSGTFTLFAVAVDSAGVWSDPVAVVLTVQ